VRANRHQRQHFAAVLLPRQRDRAVITQPMRGLFLLAVDDVENAKRLTTTDPVIANGEMVAEYHPWYGSAAAMMLPDIHKTLTPPAN